MGQENKFVEKVADLKNRYNEPETVMFTVSDLDEVAKSVDFP